MEVILVAVQSIDGFITQHEVAGTAFASPEDQRHFHRILQDFDCSVMGAETYRVVQTSIRERLSPARLRIVMTRRPADFAADASPGQLEFTDVGASRVVDLLRRRGKRRCALLGGGIINGFFLAAGLVDELLLTIEPRLFGSGTALCDHRVDRHLELLSCNPISPGSHTLLARYRLLRS